MLRDEIIRAMVSAAEFARIIGGETMVDGCAEDMADAILRVMDKEGIIHEV